MNQFLTWYYTIGLKLIGNVFYSSLLLTWDSFSIPNLIKTLAAPWRRDITASTDRSLQGQLQAAWLNLVARLIGLIVRLLTIMAGLTVEAGLIVVGVFGLVLAASAPVSLVIGLVIGLTWLVGSLSWAGFLLIVGTLGTAVAIFLLWQEMGARHPIIEPPLDQYLAQTPVGERDLYRYASFELKQALKDAPDSQVILTRMLESAPVKFILNHAMIDPAGFSLGGQNVLPPKRQLIEDAARLALKHRHKLIQSADMLLAVLYHHGLTKPALTQVGLGPEQFERLALWQVQLWHRLDPVWPLFNPKKLTFSGGVGKDWSAGYTPNLDRLSRDWTALSHNLAPAKLAHADVISSLERTLARASHHNVILVGQPGVGKRTTALAFADKIRLGKTLLPLAHKRVVEFNLTALLADTSPGQIEQKLVASLNDAVLAGNIILFIDDIDRLLAPARQGGLGAVNAAQIIVPYLESPGIQLVATTDRASWHRVISANPSLAGLFELVEITEPQTDQLEEILFDSAVEIEAANAVVIPLQTILACIRLGQRYLPDKQFPLKGVVLLDELAVSLASQGRRLASPQDLAKLIESKTHIPVGRVDQEEATILLNLENRLHQRLVNQNQALAVIAEALRRARAGLHQGTNPIGSFLFLGPTGVGKTETARALAQIYFGQEDAMIRFDMSEYQGENSQERLIGQADRAGGLLTNAIKDQPFSLLLLDEIEKAHPRVHNLLLGLLDEGRLTDAAGSTIDGTNLIIIATSNAGSNWIARQVKSGRFEAETINQNLIDHILEERIFSPEFLNRFDAVVPFRPLSQTELVRVVEIMLAKLNNHLKDQDLTIELAPQAKVKLARLGFDPVFGARALARVMRQQVEGLVAVKLLKKELTAGATFIVTEAMLEG